MRFLIDECLHGSLVEVAVSRGFEASHVNWLGLSGTKDWDLMLRIVADDFTFVTNNAIDFRRLYAKEPVHAGLVIVVPQVPPHSQRQYFASLLDDRIFDDDLVNQVIEVDLEGDIARFRRYRWP